MLPTGLLLSDLSDRAVRVWGILDELARSRPSTDITLQLLAGVTGSSRRNLSRALVELLDAGWLDRVAGVGRASTYVPLRRPRPVDNRVDDGAGTVDNPGADLGHIRPGFPADLGHIRPGLPASTLCTARARRREEDNPADRPVESAADGGAPRRPTWCGRCDQTTRQVEVGEHVERCPACHPLRVPRF